MPLTCPCQHADVAVAVALQPLAVDWRAKLKASKSKTARREAKAAARTAAAEASSSAATQPAPAAAGKPDLAALSKGLPAGWRAMWDAASGDVYFGNLDTKVRPHCGVSKGEAATGFERAAVCCCMLGSEPSCQPEGSCSTSASMLLPLCHDLKCPDEQRGGSSSRQWQPLVNHTHSKHGQMDALGHR